jgi:Fur family ferric uptake transcriptional regulator
VIEADVEVAAEFTAKLRDTFGFDTDLKHFAIFGRCADCSERHGKEIKGGDESAAPQE